MTTYSTPYKSGTFSGAPSTGAQTFTVAGMTPVATDVGRIIVITSGSAKLQHRLITAVAGSTITVEHAWDTNSFVDPTSDSRATDVLPAAGDAFSITYDSAEIAASDSDITVTGNEFYQLTGTLEVDSGAYIHFKDLTFRFAATDIVIHEGAGLIFGYYGYIAGQDAFTKNSCRLIDTETTPHGMWAGDEFGMLDIYGGSIEATAGFWRAYGNNANDTIQARWINVTTSGNFGGRTEGNRSIQIMSGSDSTSSIGLVNPMSSVARTEFSAYDSTQAVYIHASNSFGGPNGRITVRRMSGLGRALRITSGQDGGVWEIVANINEVNALPASINNVGTSTQQVQFGNLLAPRFIDSANASITETIKTCVSDTFSNTADKQTLSDGQYSSVFLKHTAIVCDSIGDLSLSDGTQYAPYSVSAICYSKQITESIADMIDTYTPNLLMLADAIVTESDEATALAYATQDTAAQVYDHLKALLVRDYDGESTTTVSRLVDDLDFGSLDVTIDGAGSGEATVTASSVTLNAATLSANVRTTGTVTLSNGAVVSGAIFDSVGDSVLEFEGVDSWEVFSDSARTTSLGTGTGSEKFRFLFSAGTTYYLTTEASGVTFQQEVTPVSSAAGTTTVQLTTEALLLALTAKVDDVKSATDLIPALL